MPENNPRGLLWARGLKKRYERTAGPLAVNGIDLDVPDGSFVTLLGPSGCGKSTTLRMLIGLERPTGGTVGFGDSVMSSAEDEVWVPPNKRNFGMVFQSYAVWPHMTVRQNVAFPLQVRRSRRTDIEKAVASALTRVDLLGLADRPARRLSGGQQQRVAIARALAQSPRVLLLDEPLSNLDAALRRQMRVELKELQRELGVTTVYVTHDQTEAFALSDEIVVIKEGTVEQVGTPGHLHDSPETVFVAEFLGGRNIIPATALAATATSTVKVSHTRVEQVFTVSRGGTPGENGFIACLAKRVRLTDQHGPNSLPVSVTAVIYEGDHWDILCDWEGRRLNAIQVERPNLEVGSSGFIHFPPECTNFVRDTSSVDAKRVDTSPGAGHPSALMPASSDGAGSAAIPSHVRSQAQPGRHPISRGR